MSQNSTFGQRSPVTGMLPPDAPIEGTSKEARIIAISRVAAIRASAPPPLVLQASLPPVEGPGPYTYRLLSPNEFRRQHLPGGAALAPHQVDGWVREQALRDPRPWWFFNDVSVPEDAIEHVDSDGVILKPGAKLRFDPAFARSGEPDKTPDAFNPQQIDRRILEYGASPRSSLQYVTVSTDGVLGTLRLLSLFYRNIWKWSAAQGVMFVLTSWVPVADAFARTLEERRGRRQREISLKNLNLAAFAAEHTEGTLEQRMALWNQLYPDWAFNRVQSFAWVSQETIRRLVGEDDGKDGER